MIKERSPYWDIVKGIGILLIVLGHSGFPIYAVQVIINYFHLSIFFFASGALYKEKYSENPISFIGRKLQYIYLPTMKYIVFFIIMNNAFIKLNIYSELTGYNMIYPKQYYTAYETMYKILEAILNSNYAVELAGAMWMVFPLIVAIVIFSLIRKFGIVLKKYNINIEFYTFMTTTILSIIGLYCTVKSYKLPWRSDISIMVMVVVYMGYIYQRYNHKIKLNLGLAILGLTALYYFFTLGLDISFAAGAITIPRLFFVATFIGIYILLYLAKISMNNRIISKFLETLGKNSFHIMALHFLAFKPINLIDIIIHNKPLFMISMFPYSNCNFWALNLISGLMIPLLLIKLKNTLKSKYMNRKLQVQK